MKKSIACAVLALLILCTGCAAAKNTEDPETALSKQSEGTLTAVESTLSETESTLPEGESAFSEGESTLPETEVVSSETESTLPETEVVSPTETEDDSAFERSWQEVFSLVETMKHDETAFTEGLSVYNGDLFESTGRYGASKIVRYKGIATDEIIEEQEFADTVFAEGSAVLDGVLYQLTWKNGAVILFDPETLDAIDALAYPREGWGLTSDGKNLIAGDGSDCLYFMDGELQTVKTLYVHCGGEKVTNINELEFDGEYILANVWMENYVAVIDYETGKVLMKIDFTDLLPENATGDNVLNGIAFDGRYYYFTGKNWNVMYKMEKLK